MRPFGTATGVALAAALVAAGLTAPSAAQADDVGSFVAGVATGALLGGAVAPPPPRPSYYYVEPRPSYVYVAPRPRYVYVVPGPRWGHYDHGRWHHWHDYDD